MDKRHVRALRKPPVTLDLGPDRTPLGFETGHPNDALRIPHVDDGRRNLAAENIDRHAVSLGEDRTTHIHLEHERQPGTLEQLEAFQALAGSYAHSVARAPHTPHER